jgi:tetratricopeptide (TPR) repeat protein
MINGLSNVNTIKNKITKMKKLAFIMMISLISATGFAQGKYGTDSVKCVQNLSLYRDYYKQKVYDDAYKYWSIVYNICPASSEKMYVEGVNLVNRLIKKNSKNPELKEAYIDSLLMIHDQRIKYFGGPGKTEKIEGRKATYMLKYRSSQPEKILPIIEHSIQGRGNKSEAGTVVTYMNTIILLEKKGLKTKEDVVESFGRMNDILAHNITKYAAKEKIQKYYIQAEESVNGIASPYLSCDVLVEMANKSFEENQEDQAWLEKTANILDKKNCTDAPIFFTIAKKLHATNPSSVSAEKMGIMSLKTKKYQEAIDFFKQAIEMNEDQSKTADYHIALASAYSSMGSYSAARAEARKAANLKSGYGLPYIMIGDWIASSSSCGGEDACVQKAIYWLAVDYYNKAKSVDPSVTGTANQKIATYKKYFPTKEDCFFGGTKEGDMVSIGCWIGESTKARF